jgi:hypothetical protein
MSTEPYGPDPVPVPAFLERYRDTTALQAVANDQRTSPSGGILKAEAALSYARVFAEHQVTNLATAAVLSVDDPSRWERVDRALAGVRGDGQSGVRRGYLWMLIGHDDLVKPDRMVLRWLARHGITVSSDQAREILAEAASAVSDKLGRRVTPWMVDHAIWRAERTKRSDAVKPSMP